jgi:hypothetical protein
MSALLLTVLSGGIGTKEVRDASRLQCREVLLRSSTTSPLEYPVSQWGFLGRGHRFVMLHQLDRQSSASLQVQCDDEQCQQAVHLYFYDCLFDRLVLRT